MRSTNTPAVGRRSVTLSDRSRLKAGGRDRRDDLGFLVPDHAGAVRQPSVVVDRVTFIQLVIDASNGEDHMPFQDQRAFLSLVRPRGRVGAGTQAHDDHLHAMLHVG